MAQPISLRRLISGAAACILSALPVCLTGCGTSEHTASPGVVQATATNLEIARGGTYSGTWSSNDPDVPAVSIDTDEPVILQNSTLSGRGDLVRITGKSGAHVTVQNVTGTGMDPLVAGRQRGSFVTASAMASLVVQQCTVTGTRHGVAVLSSQPSTLQVLSNKATELEDRASDGHGGFMTYRPDLGHFVVMNGVNAASGAEVAWNQVIQTMGASSMEDGVNLYKSQGTASSPIFVHDNYIEGASSPATAFYNGNGFIADGDTTEPVTAFVRFQANQVVHTSGGGLMIASGHDITVSGNRVVSCGVNADGSWYARSQVTAISLWNYYGASDYYNNRITGTTGGMVTPDAAGLPVISDVFANAPDLADTSNQVSGNAFDDPCFVAGVLNTTAETAERTAWIAKLQANGKATGDRRTP